MKIVILFFTLFLSLQATQNPTDTQLKKMIGHMLIVGFDESSVSKNSPIVKDIEQYELGGVILFDRFYKDRKRVKNISDATQLQKLTTDLQNYSKHKLFIAIDQEGGRVARLKPKYGFSTIPSAENVAKLSTKEARKIYTTQSKMLHKEGINLNFAPVVDLSINPKNKVIVGLKRSFSKESKTVVKFAKILIETQKKEHITSVLKHFPGHGSSLGDSHQGFVDISDSWSKKELKPYRALIKSGDAQMIMTAHVFNSHLDSKYPATLSYKINTELLRKELGFRGVIVSDDMQMKAISKHYTLQESVTLAINAGVDLLLFGNQLEKSNTKEIIETIFKAVKSGKISLSKIIEANRHIENLHTQNAIIQKPIIFTEKRKELTKEYIKQHYALEVKDISIVPQTIVLHWTAVMDLGKSFKRLNAQTLYSDRQDIASASALNVSAHFLVDRDGTIYQLMPDNWMARHVIGLNYSSIGVENVGGEANKKEDLTPAQLQANIHLIEYLKAKYPTIKNVIGHYEYREFESSPLWLEKDAGYRTKKVDPGEEFMKNVRSALDR